MQNRSETLLCDSLPKSRWITYLKNVSLTLILVKIFDIYFFHYFAINKEIAITYLYHAIEPQTMYHLIAKDKVAEQNILGKYYNCNSSGVTMALFNS